MLPPPLNSENPVSMNYKRKEVINGCTLYLGNALEILPLINEPVNMICTDPPYKLTSGGDSDVMGGAFASANYNNNGSIVKCDITWSDFMKPLADKLERGHAYVMFNNLHFEDALREGRLGGFDLHNMLVWYKKVKTQNRWYMKSCEFTAFFYKGKAKAINDCSSDQHIELFHRDVSGQFAPDGKPHPTEKPVSLMEHYIRNSTKRGELVLDPFMGVGSTIVAAIRTGRQAIGIDLDEKWFDVACRRAEAAYFIESLVEDKTENRKLAKAEKKNQTDMGFPEVEPPAEAIA